MRRSNLRGLTWLSMSCLTTCVPDVIIPPEPVADVDIPVDSVLIPAVGFERAIEATARGLDGEPLADVSFVWGSRSPHIVQVSSGGVARARALGESWVVASSGEAGDVVLVRVAQVPETLLLEGPDTIWSAAGRETLTLSMVDSAGEPILDLPEWSSSNPAVAEGYWSGGSIPRVAAHAVGEARITATLRGVSASLDVVVRQRAAQLILEYTKNFLTVGDTMSVRADVRDATSVDIPNAAVQWTTNDSTVARVDQNGFLTAVGGGNLIITARSEDLATSSTLPVYPVSPPAGALRVSPTSHHSDGFGERIMLTAVVDDGASPPAGVPATWTSRNTAVATVIPYYATTTGNGSTWLVAEYDGRKDSLAVEVQRVPVILSFQGVPREFAVTFSSGPVLYPIALDRFGGIAQTYVSPTWTIRDPSVAKVISTGIGAVRKGSTWVVIDLEGLRDSVFVTVIPQWGGDYNVTSVDDLDYFAELGIEDVTEDLRVIGTTLGSLDGLESLRTVRGELRLTGNTRLANMNGLHNVEVTGPVIIDGNPLLTVGLPALREAGSIDVFSNGALTASSFAVLRRVSGQLDLGVPGPIMSFDSLVTTGSMMWRDASPSSVHYPRLESVTNDLTLLRSDVVTFSAPQLWRVRSIDVEQSQRLTTLDVPSLTTLLRDLTIVDNDRLETLDGFSALTSGIRRLRIRENPRLRSIDGLRQVGDALGSDPIILESWHISASPELPTPAALLQFLEGKFPGDGVPDAPVP